MLTEGKAYFEVTYATRDTEIPDIATYIFIGKNVFPPQGGSDEYYFQTVDSYLKHGDFAKIKDRDERAKGDIVMMQESMIQTLYSLDALIDRLSQLASVRPVEFGTTPTEWHKHDE